MDCVLQWLQKMFDICSCSGDKQPLAGNTMDECRVDGVRLGRCNFCQCLYLLYPALHLVGNKFSLEFFRSDCSTKVASPTGGNVDVRALEDGFGTLFEFWLDYVVGFRAVGEVAILGTNGC